MTPKLVDIKVRGTDLFGARYSESAKLISVADSELSVLMWRPVAEGYTVELNYDQESHLITGQIVRVTTHLNGGQTVHVKTDSHVVGRQS
jgi:hypothetical protein